MYGLPAIAFLLTMKASFAVFKSLIMMNGFEPIQKV